MLIDYLSSVKDKKAIQVFSTFTSGDIILAHEEIDEKTNEIPTAQKLFAELGLSDYIFTLDPPSGGLSSEDIAKCC